MSATITRGLLIRSRCIRQYHSLKYSSLRFIHRNVIPRTRDLSGHSIPNQNKPRRIFYAFDPARGTVNTPQSGQFPFLRPDSVTTSPEFQHVHAISPGALSVPWPTSFPTVLESKYWDEAEDAAREFLQTILANQPDRTRGRRFIDQMVDAAISFAVHVAPMGNATRMKILAKAYVLIFMHDDAVDTGNHDAAIPRVRGGDVSPTSYRGYHMLSEEVLSEDPVLGQRLLDGMVSWGSLDMKTYPDTFASLTDYMVYRVEDVGADPIFRTAEFACGLQLPQREIDALDGLRSLCARHVLLTNDLYSFEKEAAAEKNGVKLFNAVRVVQDLMKVSASSAKAILRNIIWDVERRMSEEYEGLVARKGSALQLVRARALVVCVAGNMYFSATCARYARVVEEARLAE